MVDRSDSKGLEEKTLAVHLGGGRKRSIESLKKKKKGITLHNLELGNVFLDTIPKVQVTKENIKWTL